MFHPSGLPLSYVIYFSHSVSVKKKEQDSMTVDFLFCPETLSMFECIFASKYQTNP